MKPLPMFLSLVFSLTADLVFLHTPFELAGILLFILVQFCYRTLLAIPLLPWLKSGLLLALFLTFTADFCGIKGSLLLAAALFYFFLLLINLFHAWHQTFRSVPLLMALCLTMLLICDFHVGLYNLPRFLHPLPAALQNYCTLTAGHMIWIFYIPGQLIMVFLFLSSLRH
ncbi:MAG: hypothetical protein SOT36_09155 [Hominisplanchenecus sp.]|nr:hypothetical protein [Lachnospiraceae bacterium]MDY2820325.1 hypothetical protein [Hominisplanchenecus sp.]